MGAVVHIGYTCAACGTHYEFDTKTQSRVRVPRPKEGQTVRLGPGEKTTAVFKLPDPRDN